MASLTGRDGPGLKPACDPVDWLKEPRVDESPSSEAAARVQGGQRIEHAETRYSVPGLDRFG